jgi:iron complex outermembrane receptor protein
MKKVLVFVLLFSVVLVSPVKAEEKKPDDAVVTMEEIVVTATRDTQEIRKAPANVTVITAEEIADSGATSIVEVLDKLESVQFRTYSGNSTQAMVDIRGFGGENPFGKTLVMLDGRRMNRPDMAAANWFQIPINTIEKIEIVRGASSVLYGDAAIGGVINIITKKGKGKPAFNASALIGSYGLHNERIGVSGATDKWTYALTGENNFSSGYRDRSKYSAQGGGFDVGCSANDLFNVSLGVSFNKVDYQMPGALTKEQMEQDRRQYQPAGLWSPAHSDDDGSDKYTNVNLGVRSFWGSWGRMEINLLYGKKDLQMNMASSSSPWFPYAFSDTYTDTYGITPKYILDKKIMGFDNKVIVGMDYYNEPYKKKFYSDRERTIQSSTADFNRESIGGYIRDEFSILENLILSAGYRFEQTSIKGSNVDFADPANDFSDQKNTYNAEAYETGLTFLLGKQSKIFAKYSTVYRIPFLDEVAYFNGGGGGFLANLDKEKGISMEAGTEFYPLENLKIAMTVFRTDMEEEIQYVGFFPAGYNQNVGKTRHDGVEISMAYLLPKYFKIYGNYAYHKATFEDGDNNKKEMPLVPKHIANAGLEIYLPYSLTLKPEIQYVGNAFLSGDNGNIAEKLDAHTLLNFYAYYKPTFGKLDLTAFLGLDNIADVKYSSFGSDYGYGASYYPMPGITFKGGISINF